MVEMNILVSCDKKYLKYVCVLMESIFENNNNAPIHIFLIYKDLQDSTYKILKSFVEEKWHQKIDICDVENIQIDSLRTDNHFPIECYYTLFPHLFLPKNIDRILYLDVDTVVDRELTSFYEQNFDNNYLVACGQTKGFKKSAAMNPPGKFGYFNSGVILYNIKKMRDEISIDYYDYVLANSDKFFFDQGMLNYLFFKETKYAETLLYNFRSYIALRTYREQALEMIKNREVYIYHYTCNGIPYKPWDLYIDDASFFDTHKPVSFESQYFHISKEVNDVISIWWKYAKKTPLYEMLYNEMAAKRDYIFFFNIPDRINRLEETNSLIIQKMGASEERLKSICKLQNNMRISFLDAINYYYDIDSTGISRIFHAINNLKEYFSLFSVSDNLLMIISCKGNCDRYFNEFTNLTGLNLKKPSFRDSYYALISKSTILQEILSDNEIKAFFEYGNNSVQFSLKDNDYFIPQVVDIHQKRKGLVISKGYDIKTKTSISEIIVNNVNYSMNLIGLNIVLIDTINNSVIDSFNVNTHNDKELKIVRTI